MLWRKSAILIVMFSDWMVLKWWRFVGHTIASLRRAVIAKAFLILSSPRLEASCIGEAGINLLGGKEEEKRRRRGKERI